jgi:hypothetical protein
VQAHGEAHGALVTSREALHQVVAHLGERARLVAEEAPRRGRRRAHVQPLCAIAEHRLHPARQRRLQRGAQLRVVPGHERVQRPAHGRRADDLPLLEQARELLAAEALEAGPQRHERGPRHLRLQRHEPLDGAQGRDTLAREEHLTAQRRATQRACGHDDIRHRGPRIRGGPPVAGWQKNPLFLRD